MSTLKMNYNQYAELFLKFVSQVKTQISNLGDDFEWQGVGLETELDPNDPKNTETLIQLGWNAMANYWVAVESLATYKATFVSLLERLSHYPKHGKGRIKVLSVGSGPGLYEIFLAKILSEHGFQIRFFSTDYSESMIDFQNRILESGLKIEKMPVGRLRPMVTPSVANMTNLPEYFEDKFDIVICNNALQWTDDWKEAIAEISRSLNPKSQIQKAILIIHPHAMRVCAGSRMVKRPLVDEDSLLDELYKHNLSPQMTRLLIGPPGSGQVSTASLARMMIETKYYPLGECPNWRSLAMSSVKATAIPFGK